MKKSWLYPEKKAGGLMAISRSVTEGNHRKRSENNSRALEARSENKLNAVLSFQEGRRTTTRSGLEFWRQNQTGLSQGPRICASFRLGVLDRAHGSLQVSSQWSPGFRFASPRATFCRPLRDFFHANKTEVTTKTMA